ncbi:MAG: hybrid sensor histidine kinase/response regulator [Mucilaginibacter polytrichastri]|nr:hybrid sensor histidine kinase/response regulator [Mucilaginibacter polytrichastri]
MILLVDDKSENLIALKNTLESRGFETDAALSGEEALKKILKRDYALIILDVQMPGMDGFEVAEAISGYSRTRDVPIIFLSAVNVSKQFITKGYASGGRDYLVKPFDTDILVLKIRTFIRLHEQNLNLSRIRHSLTSEIEQRKQAEKLKDEFISIASHELNSPLTSVKGYLQLAERSLEKQDIEQSKMFIHRSRSQVDKLNRIVSDLVDSSHMESGRLHFQFRDFFFESFLDNTIDSFQQANPDICIERRGTAPLIVHGDEARIEQVLMNFLNNAVKYAPDSKEIVLDIHTQDDERIEVRVRDFGIGIPKEKQAMVFDKFYRVEETSAQFKGMGMGLYICAEIIREHKGEYGVESDGRGSTFYFRIPAKAETDFTSKNSLVHS